MNMPLLPTYRVPLLALLATGLGACATPHAFHPEDQPSVDDVRASREDVVEPQLRPGERLTLLARGADVSVEVAEGPPRIVARIEARARDAAAAERALQDARLELRPAEVGQELGLARDHELSVDAELVLGFRAVVPSHTTLATVLDEGQVTLDGTLGAFHVELGLGDVRIDNAGGELELALRSGAVEVEDTNCSFLGVSCESGEVVLARVQSERQQIELGSGLVSIEASTSAHTELTLGHAEVRLVELEGELTAQLDGGELELIGGGPASRRIRSNFAPLVVRNGSGALEAQATFGQVRVLGFDGELRAHSGYGPVEVEGRFDALDAKSGSGPMRATIAQGSVMSSPWRMHSNHGDVILTLPADTSARLEAVTPSGTIECAFPVLMDAGVIDGGRTLRGAINDGGETLELATGAGDIRVLNG